MAESVIHTLVDIAAQLLFVAFLGYAAVAIVAKLCADASPGERWCAVAIASAWLLAASFALLMTLGLFRPLPAMVVGCLIATAVWLRLDGPRAVLALAASDLERLWQTTTLRGHPCAWRTVMYASLTLAVLLAVRVLLLPPLGWDTLTHHGVKVALWLQTGSWTDLQAPGGWEYYRLFLGGGEVFTAWSRLYVRSDLLAGFPDLAFWLLTGLATAAMARHMGLNVRTSVLLGAAIAASPAFTAFVGSGYVDSAGTAFLLTGILFLLRHSRGGRSPDACIAAAALGLAASVKVNLLFVSTAAFAILVGLLYASPGRRWRMTLLALGLYLVPVLPWLALNTVRYGYPLGCVPLEIGPVHLGKAPANLVWFLDRPDLTPYNARAELGALALALMWFQFSLVLCALGAVGVAAGLRRKTRELGILLSLAVAVLFLYFSPSFSLVRLNWPRVNGRFIAPALICLGAGGLWFFQGWPRARQLLDAAAAAGVLLGLYTYIYMFMPLHDPIEALALAVTVLSMAVLLSLACWKRRRLAVLLGCLGLTAALLVCSSLKDNLRLEAYAHNTVLHDSPRYWVPALRALSAEPPPTRIAFAYGPEQTSHHAFLAPFFGSRLENSLTFVSPEEDGRVLPHQAEALASANPRYEVWRARLLEYGCTHVLLLKPPCTELRWVEENPARFCRLAGEKGLWGLYRILP